MTSLSLSNQFTLGRYNTERDRPTIRQALAFDKWWWVVINATAACFACGVTTFVTARP